MCDPIHFILSCYTDCLVMKDVHAPYHFTQLPQPTPQHATNVRPTASFYDISNECVLLCHTIPPHPQLNIWATTTKYDNVTSQLLSVKAMPSKPQMGSDEMTKKATAA